MTSLREAVEKVEKSFGLGSVMRLDADAPPIEVISSGSIGLDAALGVGGYPRGRIVEIFGPESSGKSTLCLHAVASAQKAGGNAVYIDVEHSLDPIYGAALGVDVSSLLVSQPDTAEQALEICEMLVLSGEVSLLVVDSVAALLPRSELEGDYGDSHVGLLPRLMSQAMRKMTGPLEKTRTTALFVNQLREKIGTMGYGPSETTSGGRALKYYASIRADCRRIETMKRGDEAIGNRTRVKVVKNKVAAPHRTCEFEIIYGQGISREGELLDLAIEKNLVKKSGSWFKYGDRSLGQGRESVRSLLREDLELSDELEYLILG